MRCWLLGRLHVSWLVGWLAIGLLLGVAVSAWWPLLFDALTLFVLSGALFFTAVVKRRRWMVLLVVTAVALVGLWRGGMEQVALREYVPLYGGSVMLSGTVSEDTSYGPHGDQRLRLQQVQINGERLAGQVWVSADSLRVIKRSDRVVLRGKLGKGFGNLPASMFHAHVQEITHPQPGDAGLMVRDWFAAGIRRAIPEPQSSLGVGYLVGQRSVLPEELDNELKVVGLTHAVVASGYNLTILVSFARQLFLGVSKYLAVLSAGGMIAGFVMITGLSPSMSRAGLVASLSLGAWYYGRKIHPLVLLPFAAAVTVILNPAYVWGDIGWYLSFGAFFGVVVVAPLVQRYFWGDTKPSMLRQLVVDTMSAQAMTMPIVIFTFGYYSVYALIANILVLPLVPLTMVLTFGAGVFGLIVPGAAQWFGLPATFILRYMTRAIGWIAGWPGAQGNLTVGVSALIGVYVVVLLAVIFLWRMTHYSFREEAAAEMSPPSAEP